MTGVYHGVGVPRAARSRAPAAAAVRSRGATPDAAACCRGLDPPIAIGPCRGTGSVPVAGLLLYVCGVPATATPAPIRYWMRQIPDAAAAGKPGKARPAQVMCLDRRTDGGREGKDAAPNILPRAHARPVALCCVHGGFAGSMSTGCLAVAAPSVHSTHTGRRG